MARTYRLLTTGSARGQRFLLILPIKVPDTANPGPIPEFRRIGVAGGLVRGLADQADVGRLPVRCHVLQDSTARRFWEHAGFVARGRDGAYVAMERAPLGRPP